MATLTSEDQIPKGWLDRINKDEYYEEVTTVPKPSLAEYAEAARESIEQS
jgi:hypothetical protein